MTGGTGGKRQKVRELLDRGDAEQRQIELLL
jgi:hypothetical protein